MSARSSSSDGGFLVPWLVKRFNAGQRHREFNAYLDRLIGPDPTVTREGIPVDTWRALPDSPNA